MGRGLVEARCRAARYDLRAVTPTRRHAPTRAKESPQLQSFATRCNALVPPRSCGRTILRYPSPAALIGLHLNYELRLPACTERDVVVRTLTDLHAFAQTLAFDELSPVLIEHGHPIDKTDRLATLRFFASIIATPDNEDILPLTGDPNSAQGFFVHAGRGCETAAFGLMRRADIHGAHAEWFWHGSCKTQYASIVSDAHLIACHTALVRVLDHAITLGIDVVVRDETHYWDTRDASRLVDEVRAMNQLVARFAGQLSDVVGETHEVRASIFEHPRFERLEMGDGE